MVKYDNFKIQEFQIRHPFIGHITLSGLNYNYCKKNIFFIQKYVAKYCRYENLDQSVHKT